MKKIVMILVAVTMATFSYGQEAPKDTTYWKKKTELGFNFNQGSFSDSWQGGGVSSYALGALFNAKSEYLKDRDNWVNDFQSQFGMQKIKGQEFRKSLDRLFFDSKYGRRLGSETSKWYFFAEFNVLTQFGNGHDYNYAFDNGIYPKTSAFFTPLYLTEAIGIEWKPVKYFNVSFAPGAVRQTILGDKNLYKELDRLNALQSTDTQYEFKNYGVTRGKAVQTDVALMQLVLNFDKDLVKNVNLKWRYQGFMKLRDLAAIDNRLDVTFTAKIYKYFTFNFNLIGMYYQDQVDRIQLAQTMGIGFLHTF
ncbi:MAG: DUF3078 domain-containing protein [Siphonobacter sp.]